MSEHDCEAMIRGIFVVASQKDQVISSSNEFVPFFQGVEGASNSQALFGHAELVTGVGIRDLPDLGAVLKQNGGWSQQVTHAVHIVVQTIGLAAAYCNGDI